MNRTLSSPQACILAAVLATALVLPGRPALASSVTHWSTAAGWSDPTLAGNVYKSGLLVKDQLEQAQQAVDAQRPRLAAARLRFALTHLSWVKDRNVVPYQDLMHNLKEARLALHDHDPLLTAGYFRSLRAEIDHIAQVMPGDPATASKAIDYLDHAEQAVRFTGRETADWQNPVNYERSDWKAADAALKALQDYLQNHTAYVPLDYIANQVSTALYALHGGPQPDWAMARAAIGEALTATMSRWVNDKALQDRWGAEKESADPLHPQRAAPLPAPRWSPGQRPHR